jgi:3-mercaptopyruvate sulfurtransferase SseA
MRHGVLRLFGVGAIAFALAACANGATSVPPSGAPVPGASAPVGAYEAPRVTPEQANARIQAGENLVILDVRSASAYQAGHIPGAINIPWANLKDDYSQLPKDRFILLYCT